MRRFYVLIIRMADGVTERVQQVAVQVETLSRADLAEVMRWWTPDLCPLAVGRVFECGSYGEVEELIAWVATDSLPWPLGRADAVTTLTMLDKELVT